MTNQSDFRSLEFRIRLLVWWGFLWRGLIITLASMLVGGLVGGVVGFLAAILGVPPENKSLLTGLGAVAGLIVGLYFLWVYLHWLFRARFGGYRLQLVEA